jgi:hypothetical protein
MELSLKSAQVLSNRMGSICPRAPNQTVMADQIVITEKTSQAKDVRAAVGSRYGDILPAEGHLFDLLEPEDVVPAWKRWSPILLRPESLVGTRPAEGGNKAAKLKAIREALRTAELVWLATDCDREGQLIGQEILEHYNFSGQVMRVLFTAQDSQSIRDAFGRATPNIEYARLYAAAVARRQADQIYNLSLTRTATVILGQNARGVIGVGRVKTPTLAIVCQRELEIRDFVPVSYFEVVVTAKVTGGQFQMHHAPQERILRREIAEAVANAAQGFEGALRVRVEDKRQGPPKLHDLPSLQKLCGSRFGWTAARTLEVAQELYDGQGKKIITYPRAEVRYLPESLITDVPRIVAGLRVGQPFSTISLPDPPVIRKGQAAVSTIRAWRVRVITRSFPMSTRSMTFRRSGRAFRPTRKTCSTSSRGHIWPPSCPTFAIGRQPRPSMSGALFSALPVASLSISAGAPHSLNRSPTTKRTMKRNCFRRCATARRPNCTTRPLRTKRPGPRRATTKAP